MVSRPQRTVMISPTSIVGYLKAEESAYRAFTDVNDKLRKEFVKITKSDRAISIGFTLLDTGTRPRINAIYEDGVREPEVYVDRNDWDNFNSLEFSYLGIPSDDILFDTIKYEFRKEMQRFFEISEISDNFLKLFLFNNKDSTIERTGYHNLKIFYKLDGCGVTLEFVSKKATISVNTSGSDESGPFNFTNKFRPLTENIDLKDGFDPIKAAKCAIGKIRNATDLADGLLRALSQSFEFKTMESFPCVELLCDNTTVRVRLLPDYARISISAKGRCEYVSLERTDIAEIVKAITKLTASEPDQ